VKRIYALNRFHKGLLVVPRIWHELDDFSSGAVCLVISSMANDTADFIRDYKQFKNVCN
jgi:hypothetical protein